MFKNYLVIAFRNLWRDKNYTVINILGLAVALTACLLIGLFVRDEWSFDTHWQEADEIYRFNSEMVFPGSDRLKYAVAPIMMKDDLLKFFPEEIESIVRIVEFSGNLRVNNAIFNGNLFAVDSEMKDFFELNIISGSLTKVLENPSSIAISESLAKKIFGEVDNVLGKSIEADPANYSYSEDLKTYQIDAIFKDLPHNTILNFNMLVKLEDFKFPSWLLDTWSNVRAQTFFKLKQGISIDQVKLRLNQFINKYAKFEEGSLNGRNKTDTFKLIPARLKDIYLDERLELGKKTGGNRFLVNILIFTSIIILVLAIINFINLTTAKSSLRSREVALRKVLGARKNQLILQFLIESMLLALLSLFIAFVLVEIFLPLYNNFLGKELALSFNQWSTWLLVGLLVLGVGIGGGFYPALILSSFMPAKALKTNRSIESKGTMRLRNSLVIFQFVVSVSLIVSVSAVYFQMRLLQNMDLGYNKNNLLLVDFTSMDKNFTTVEKPLKVFKQEVLNLPSVKSAAFFVNYPYQEAGGYNALAEIPNQSIGGNIMISRHLVDFDFFKTYQFELLAGRFYNEKVAGDNFDREVSQENAELFELSSIIRQNIIINETAVRQLDLGTPEKAIGKEFTIDNRNYLLTIVGVVKDARIKSLAKPPRPELYQGVDRGFYLVLRYISDLNQVTDDVARIWEKIFLGNPFSYRDFDEIFQSELKESKRLAQQLMVFALIAIIIACLGLFGLANFTAQRRIKEIGLRKVMGASVIDILKLLLWQFSKPVLLANLIAWPLIIWVMNRWLSSFAYRIDIWWLVALCCFGGVIALLIAWVTVISNALKVAKANPINALRYE